MNQQVEYYQDQITKFNENFRKNGNELKEFQEKLKNQIQSIFGDIIQDDDTKPKNEYNDYKFFSNNIEIL